MFVQRFKGAFYLAVAALTWYFMQHASEWIIARRYFPTPNFILELGEYFHHIVGFVSAVVVLVVLFMNAKANQFIEEVAVETSKVSWPTLKETVNAAVVVSVAVIVAGFMLSFVDMSIGWIFRKGLEFVAGAKG
jgi:preprotein translocase SecE subunit